MVDDGKKKNKKRRKHEEEVNAGGSAVQAKVNVLPCYKGNA